MFLTGINFILFNESCIEWDSVLTYLDDIIVYARTFDEHLRNFDLVLSCLELHGLILKPLKFTLFKCEGFGPRCIKIGSFK